MGFLCRCVQAVLPERYMKSHFPKNYSRQGIHNHMNWDLTRGRSCRRVCEWASLFFLKAQYQLNVESKIEFMFSQTDSSSSTSLIQDCEFWPVTLTLQNGDSCRKTWEERIPFGHGIERGRKSVLLGKEVWGGLGLLFRSNSEESLERNFVHESWYGPPSVS